MTHANIGTAAAVATLLIEAASATVVTFEGFPLGPQGYWNGSDLSGTPAAGSFGETSYSQVKDINGLGFRNTYTDWGGYGSWSGFAVSNHTDAATAGYLNEFSAITGAGAGGSANYVVGFYATYETSTNLSFGVLTNLAGKGASFTNTTYAALEMLNGGLGKKFGGASGNDADWFKLTISGYAGGIATGTSVDFYLADFRFADNSQDYVLDEWEYVDFSALGTVDELRFTLSSSDNGAFGMNTPAYFAMDDLNVVPEPSSFLVALSGLGLLLRRKR